MTYDEYREEMRKLGWSEKRIDDHIKMFEKIINIHPVCKATLKLEDYLREPPVIYSANFSEETMEKYWNKSEENS